MKLIMTNRSILLFKEKNAWEWMDNYFLEKNRIVFWKPKSKIKWERVPVMKKVPTKRLWEKVIWWKCEMLEQQASVKNNKNTGWWVILRWWTTSGKRVSGAKKSNFWCVGITIQKIKNKNIIWYNFIWIILLVSISGKSDPISVATSAT